MLALGFLFASFLVPVIAAPAPINIGLGIEFGPGSNDLPTLKLPYATYKAYSYDVTDDYYTFRNIRFAAPPLGERRWQKPAPPENQTGIQDGSVGFQCPQALPDRLSFAYPLLANLEPYSEDCLFLDVLVPGKAIRGEVKDLPVMVWLFGGGYVLGSKSFFLYDGHPLLKAADNNMIYVAPNYRLGAFGFLAGTHVEKEGVPNSAFWDQRAAFQWVQDHISLVGGNPSSVTAMGESAGAGSIMHQLVAMRGKLQPQFHRAIFQSPAFEPVYDEIKINITYSAFESAAGCAGQGLSCLRSKSEKELQDANLKVVGAAQYGSFGFGPAVDNVMIFDLPGVEFARGNYWKGLEGVVVGHNTHEGVIFADPTKVTNKQMDGLMLANFPKMSAAGQAALKRLYPEPGLFKEYKTNFQRLSAFIGDWSVNCNARYIAEAYKGKSWAYSFSIPPGIHAMDLVFTFFRTDLNLWNIFQLDIDIDFITQKNLATGFQSYLTSFVRSGDPNKYRQKGGIPWTIDMPKAEFGKTVKALDVGLLGFKGINDDLMDQEKCGFWGSAVWTGRDGYTFEK
ncbi:Alpha/Beta hydrolase protein [Pyronema omphalodes]|nr:Alpha/Beta hydrolase protein [Pyronema omphalodes]